MGWKKATTSPFSGVSMTVIYYGLLLCSFHGVLLSINYNVFFEVINQSSREILVTLATQNVYI